jgi:predicted nucleic acid-binding protein
VLIVDTGVLLAAADRADPDHQTCARLVASEPGPLVTTGLVIAEASYLIERQLGPSALAAFFRSLADGDLLIEALTGDDLRRIATLVEQYATLQLGGTDASLLAIAERLAQTRVATLDRRHFTVVRLADGTSLELIP